jgi:preprotein translocase subunit SecE
MADTTKTTKQGFGKRIKRFFTETKAELKKVTWPSREQLIHNTLVILVFIILAAIVLSLLDAAFGELFKLITKFFA